jgi:hypothetical protein
MRQALSYLRSESNLIKIIIIYPFLMDKTYPYNCIHIGFYEDVMNKRKPRLIWGLFLSLIVLPPLNVQSMEKSPFTRETLPLVKILNRKDVLENLNFDEIVLKIFDKNEELRLQTLTDYLIEIIPYLPESSSEKGFEYRLSLLVNQLIEAIQKHDNKRRLLSKGFSYTKGIYHKHIIGKESVGFHDQLIEFLRQLAEANKIKLNQEIQSVTLEKETQNTFESLQNSVTNVLKKVRNHLKEITDQLWEKYKEQYKSPPNFLKKPIPIENKGDNKGDEKPLTNQVTTIDLEKQSVTLPDNNKKISENQTKEFIKQKLKKTPPPLPQRKHKLISQEPLDQEKQIQEKAPPPPSITFDEWQSNLQHKKEKKSEQKEQKKLKEEKKLPEIELKQNIESPKELEKLDDRSNLFEAIRQRPNLKPITPKNQKKKQQEKTFTEQITSRRLHIQDSDSEVEDSEDEMDLSKKSSFENVSSFKKRSLSLAEQLHQIDQEIIEIQESLSTLEKTAQEWQEKKSPEGYGLEQKKWAQNKKEALAAPEAAKNKIKELKTKRIEIAEKRLSEIDLELEKLQYILKTGTFNEKTEIPDKIKKLQEEKQKLEDLLPKKMEKPTIGYSNLLTIIQNQNIEGDEESNDTKKNGDDW